MFASIPSLDSVLQCLLPVFTQPELSQISSRLSGEIQVAFQGVE